MVLDVDKGIEFVAYGGAGLLGLALVGRRLLTRFMQEGAEGSRAAAERDVIETLRTELTRLATQNGLLSSELNRLQVSMHELNAEISALRIENGELKREIAGLHSEISRMGGLSRWHRSPPHSQSGA